MKDQQLKEELKDEIKDEVIQPVDMEDTLEARKKEVEDFVANEDNRKKAWELALDMQRYMGNKWFTLEKAVKKTGMKPEVTFQKIKLLELFGYATIDKGDPMNTKERGRAVFHLTIDPQQKIDALEHVIITYQNEIDKAKLQILQLKNEQSNAATQVPSTELLQLDQEGEEVREVSQSPVSSEVSDQ